MIPTVFTFSGKYVNFLEPTNICIQDIAHALSNICRFTGHTKDFYSVAQHSVLVSFLCKPENAKYGLLHDAAEAYIGDISSPLKACLPDYKLIERNLLRNILLHYRLQPFDDLPEDVKYADLQMLATEKRDLLKTTENWPILEGIAPIADKIQPLAPIQAKALFELRYRELFW